MESVSKTSIGKGFQYSLIDHSKDSVSFLITSRDAKKKFVQIISMVLNQDDFVSIEIFVSNLSVTEPWAELQINLDYAAEYLAEMLAIVKQELSKSLTTDAQFDATLKQIDKNEMAREKMIEKLSQVEKKVLSAKDAAAEKKFSKELLNVENACIHSETEVSKLTYRYFVNAMDEVDPFFFGLLF